MSEPVTKKRRGMEIECDKLIASVALVLYNKTWVSRNYTGNGRNLTLTIQKHL